MAIADDGSILPSFLRMGGVEPGLREAMTNEFAMRPGVVIKKYPPDDKESFSKTTWEYDVECTIIDGQGQPTVFTYPHCIMASMFGSIPDHFYWAPRIEEKNGDDSGAGDKKNAEDPNKGSQVLLFCVNGQARTAFIVGATQHSLAKEPPKGLADGPYAEFEYNGLNVKIDNDGALQILRKGPTKVDGDPVDDKDKKVNAAITMEKDGIVRVITGDGKNSIVMNLDDGEITISSDKSMKLEVANGKLETSASNGVKLGGDEKMMLGNKYTDAEDSFLGALDQFLTQLLVGLTSSAAGLTASGIAAGGATGLTQIVSNVPVLKAQIAVFKTKLKSQVLSKKNSTE